MIEVDLQPGALHRLTGIPFREMVNTDIDAETVFSAEIRRVNERLNNSDSYQEMIAVIEHFFFRQVDRIRKKMSPVDHALHLMSVSNEDQSVDAIARMSYLSPRQLERKFIESIGVGPKTFSRICRFNRSYWLRFADPLADWYDIAISCGYTDYQHMVKDYKSFAFATPSRFFSEDSQAPGMVLGVTSYTIPTKNVGFLPV
jgi:transcriptional regulator GlxA family with amidase domain